jgi:hypothetical protein
MKNTMAVMIPFAGRFAPALRPVLARLAQAGLLALLAAGASAQAQSRFDEDFDDSSKPWQEIAIQLPALPQKENLLEFDVGETATMRFFVDAKSISVGDDAVVRYTLVSRSPSGAENISYEGLRCETQERKLYAFGHKDGSWSRSRRDQWERYTGTVANSQHAALARDYFCTHKVVEGNAEQITRRLRDKRPLMEVLTR